MNLRHQRLGFDQQIGPIAAVIKVRGGGDGAPKYRPLAFTVGPIASGANAPDRFAVGIDDSDIDPVIGGAAHQTNGA
jgi:hypothetical protein